MASRNTRIFAIIVLIIAFGAVGLAVRENIITQESKARLIKMLSNAESSQAISAVNSLEAYGWLSDGTLSDQTILHVNLPQIVMRDAVIINTDMLGSNFSEAVFYDSNLSGTDFILSNFSKATLYDVNLSYAVMYDVDLTGAVLDGANLSNVDFRSADLRDADLIGANLTGADLRRAFVSGADFTNATLDWVKLPDGAIWDEDVDITRYTDPNHPDFWEPEVTTE